MIQQVAIALSDRASKVVVAVAAIALAVVFVLQPAPGRRVVVTDTEIEILDRVRFLGKDTIATRSLRTLDAMAQTLIGNPSIRLVEIQANTEARAAACVAYLIGQGVEPNRLVTGVIERSDAAFVILERAEDVDSQP